ncbi:MAG: efflux RND transporter periplasmic adaptor subunit [Saprospiraceae bacterium]
MKKIVIGLFAAALLASCHSHDHEGGHAHNPDGSHVTADEPGLEPLAYTLYTDKTELFVEFKPLVVGEESRFAAHFTSLGESFKAVGEGSVTLSFTGGPVNQSITADAPEVPGIFRLHLTPEKAGQYKLVFDLKTPAYAGQITIDGVTVYPDEKTALENQSTESGSSSVVTYLKEQAWKIDFANMPVQRTAFFDVVKTSGMVAAAPGSEQTVAARTPGIVSFANNSLMTGSPVGTGQRLFSISSKGFTGDNAPLKLQEAKIALDKAKADVERLQRLLADQLTTQREFLLAKTELENAQAFYNSLSGSYGQSGQSIAAAQGGFIKTLLVTPGQFVEAGQPLAIISKNNRLTVKAELSQTAFAKIGSITSANFRVNNQTVYSMKDLNGRLLSVGKFAGESMFIPVWFEIDNRAGIIPGTYIEVFIQTNAVSNALVIPTSALMEEQGNYYCYVQTEGESFEKRELLLGGNDGRQVQVLSGIIEGDRVVTKGAYNIKLSTASGTMPAHGHEH